MEECVKQVFEDAFNRILPGLQMLVRDVNLAEETAAKYTPGILIRETAFAMRLSVLAGWQQRTGSLF